MRVLFLIYSLAGGGAERVTAGLANHWAGRGHEVTVVLLGTAENGTYTLDDRVHVEALGVGSDSFSPMKALAATRLRLATVTAVLGARRPDIALGMTTTPAILLALAGGPRNIIRIGAERTYPPFAEVSRVWRLARPLAYSRLDAVVAQTTQAAEWLRRRSLARRIEVIHNPWLEGGRAGSIVDPIEAGGRLLLSIGRLTREKQFDRLIDSFSGLAADRPDWRLAILGEGPERERLERHRDASCCAERIHLVGRVSNVDAWLARADLFAMSSHFEGFPNALLEAYCAGVPCASFDCLAGPSTIIENGKDGILTPADNFPELAKTLGFLMDHPAARGELARQAVARRVRFDISVIAARWEALFADLRAHR